MISLHCDLFIPEGLKKFFTLQKNFPAVFNELTVQCEFGLQLKKAQIFHAGRPLDPATFDFATAADFGNMPMELGKMSVDFGNEVGNNQAELGTAVPAELEEFPVEIPGIPVHPDGGGVSNSPSSVPPTSTAASTNNSTWKNLTSWINDGLKLLNEESLQFTVKFVVEFPSRTGNCIEDEKEESKQIVQENPPLPHELTEMVPNLDFYQNNEPELVKEVRRILALSLPDSIELCSEGIGGTYFIKNEQGNRIAVFKPTDEEPGAENNPKDKIDDPLLPPGGGSIREVAAYVLDQGFAGVPETYLVSGIEHPIFSSMKSGSLQKYVSNIIEDSDISSSRYSVDDVHKIGILDVRLYNMDRNAENLLIQNLSSPKLIPIDHSYVLPPELSFLWFEWLHWKQAKQPFSEEILSYIQSIDIQKDAETLRQLGFERSAIRTMMISSTLLKISAVKYGYNLNQIGTLMSRKSIKDQSALEKMVKKTMEILTREKIEQQEYEQGFMEALVRIIEEELSSSSGTISQNNLKKTK